MHYQSQHLTQQLLTPLNAVFQDVQKNLQMELDVERVLQNDELTESPIKTSSLANKEASFASGSVAPATKPDSGVYNTISTAVNPTIIEDALATISSNSTLASPTISPVLPIDNAQTSTGSNEIASNTLSTWSNNAAFAGPPSNQALPLTAVDNIKTTINANKAASNTTPGESHANSNSQPNLAVPLIPVEHNKQSTNDNRVGQAEAVQLVNTNASNPTAPITDVPVIEQANSFAKNLSPSEAVKQETVSINDPAVLIPLRSEPAANITATAPSPNSKPSLPSATAKRLEAVVEPALQQAYSITQQHTQGVNDESADPPATELVRNTFNVSVAMNNHDDAKAVNLADFEQALTEVLLTAARRQGLEV